MSSTDVELGLTEFGPYFIGDTPRPLTLNLEDDGAPVLWDDADSITGQIIPPTGAPVSVTFTPVTGESTVPVVWPVGYEFEAEGVYRLRIIAQISGVTVTVQTRPWAVESFAGWHTIETARELWADLPSDQVEAYNMLNGARGAVEDYDDGRVLTGPTVAVPDRFRQAQLMQARAVWNATKTGSEEQIGVDGFAVRVYPLDRNIRQLIRPRSGRPVIL